MLYKDTDVRCFISNITKHYNLGLMHHLQNRVKIYYIQRFDHSHLPQFHKPKERMTSQTL